MADDRPRGSPTGPAEPHDRHVADGHCSVISWTKAWCGLPAAHSGPHGSPRTPHPGAPVGPQNPTWVEWHA